MPLALVVALVLTIAPGLGRPAFAQARAQEMAPCAQEHAGERICRAGNVCVCRMTGGSMLGIPLALRWDCSIGNGNCIDSEYRALSPLPYTAMPVPPTRGRAAAQADPGPGRAEIADMQKALSRLGFDPGPADGVFGPRTKAALNAFQRRERMPVTDRPTPEALARLKG